MFLLTPHLTWHRNKAGLSLAPTINGNNSATMGDLQPCEWRENK